MIAREAMSLLTDKAKARTSEILGDMSIEDASEWADKMKWVSPYGATRKDHYVNIPFTALSYNKSRDCNDGRCVVEAIRKHIDTLKRTDSAYEERVALLFLIHLVADLHQPLHVSHPDNRGGNKTKGVFQFNEVQIEDKEHRILDSAVIEICNLNIQDSSSTIGDITNYNVVEWTNETLEVSRRISFPASCDSLGYLVEYQMALAAHRLAYTLNEIFDSQCCSMCVTGKPCGDSCIAKSGKCSKDSGCACQAP